MDRSFIPGWYVDDLLVGPGSCQAQAGSLLVGNVYDANTSAGLTGALVTSDSGEVAVTQATPDDPNLPDGFYTHVRPAGDAYLHGDLRDRIRA